MGLVGIQQHFTGWPRMQIIPGTALVPGVPDAVSGQCIAVRPGNRADPRDRRPAAQSANAHRPWHCRTGHRPSGWRQAWTIAARSSPRGNRVNEFSFDEIAAPVSCLDGDSELAKGDEGSWIVLYIGCCDNIFG